MTDTNPIVRDRFGNPTGRTLASDAAARRAPARPPTIAPYAERVRALEGEGLCTSDAQGVADAERRITVERAAALAMLGRATQGHYAPDMMAGGHKARERAAIFSLLVGRKVTAREAGVTALESYLLNFAPITGSCLARRRDAFAVWCAAQLRRA